MAKWKDLSPAAKCLVATAATVDLGLKAVALRDLKSRPAAQVRGPRWLWALALTLVGSAGALPGLYLLWGRKG